jgi:hypothetical protein
VRGFVSIYAGIVCFPFQIFQELLNAKELKRVTDGEDIWIYYMTGYISFEPFDSHLYNWKKHYAGTFPTTVDFQNLVCY